MGDSLHLEAGEAPLALLVLQRALGCCCLARPFCGSRPVACPSPAALGFLAAFYCFIEDNNVVIVRRIAFNYNYIPFFNQKLLNKAIYIAKKTRFINCFYEWSAS